MVVGRLRSTSSLRGARNHISTHTQEKKKPDTQCERKKAHRKSCPPARLRYQNVWHSLRGQAMVVSVLGGRLRSTSSFRRRSEKGRSR